MGYKLIIEKSAAKAIEKFDSQPRKQILLFLKELGQIENPRQVGKALQNDRRLWRYRVGNYRIIANIDQDCHCYNRQGRAPQANISPAVKRFKEKQI